MFCSKCGKENLDTNKFCNECGSPLHNQTVPIPPTNQHPSDPVSDLFGKRIELPSELKNLTFNGQSLEFTCGLGKIIRATRHLQNQVQASGGGGNISTYVQGYTQGHVQPINITNETIDMFDIWIKPGNDDEVNCQLFKSPVGFLEGQEVAYILAHSSDRMKPPITVLLKSLNSDNGYSYGCSRKHLMILENNPSGLFKNPQKKQQEYDDACFDQSLKIAKFISAEHIDKLPPKQNK